MKEKAWQKVKEYTESYASWLSKEVSEWTSAFKDEKRLVMQTLKNKTDEIEQLKEKLDKEQ